MKKQKMFGISSNHLLFSVWLLSGCIVHSSAIKGGSAVIQCGVQELKSYSHDDASEIIREYEYPWKAMFIRTQKSGNRKNERPGTLVNKNTILTVASLFKIHYNENSSQEISKLRVILGLRKLKDLNESGREEFSVQRYVLHPNWSRLSNYHSNNIAIVTLNEDVTFNRYIRPICLPDDSLFSIQKGEMASWDAGANDGEVTARRKKLQIIEDGECTKLFSDFYASSTQPATNQSFCTGGDSFCLGSVGDGFYVQKNSKFYIRGFISNYIITGSCKTHNTAKNVDVVKHLDFLRDNNVTRIEESDHEDFDERIVEVSKAHEEDCGVATLLTGQISNGEDFPHGLLPWSAAVIKYANRKQTFICGGTLVSSKKVVTAAHCIHNKGEQKSTSNYELLITLGAHDLSERFEPGSRTFRVESIEIHPNWNPANIRKFTGDIALLVFEKPVEFDDYIKPICLSSDLPFIEKGTVAGWGRREDQAIGMSNDTPRKIDIPIIDDKLCYENEPRLAGGGWDESFCAGREGVNVCNGDSGSGLYVKHMGKYYLKGIVSNAILTENCDESHYALFTDAAKYKLFITKSFE